jgi:hypothetical protein
MGLLELSGLGDVLRKWGLGEAEAIRAIDAHLLPTYAENDIHHYLEEDLVAVPVSWTAAPGPGHLPFATAPGGGESEIAFWDKIIFQNGIEVLLPQSISLREASGFSPALAGLSRLNICSQGSEKIEISWPNGIRVYTPDHGLAPIIEKIALRLKRVSKDRASELTKSAYYMGSKYSISSFLVEGIAGFLPSNGVVVDLMCGAGSATRAFSLYWDVLACDALRFCTCLASGFGRQADSVSLLDAVSTIQKDFSENMSKLETLMAPLLEAEETFLYSQLGFDEGLGQKYSDFVSRTPRFPEGGKCMEWNPVEEVICRQLLSDRNTRPYCLLSAYFGNVYFGLRQAMELDSLRFAIDQLPNKEIREAALAAAVATASYIGTGFASQFAQPVKVPDLSKGRLFDILERRAIRIFPEFAARLTALASVKAETSQKISFHTGKWEESLEKVPDFSDGRPTCIYIDAPYTRDEYARYYHVLETFCRYDYPESVGKGRVPSRKNGEMFKSKFFTRTNSSIAPMLAEIICKSLKYSDFCAWSYSSRAIGSIPDVIRLVEEQGNKLLASFSVSHKYNAQGRTSQRVYLSNSLDEYLFVFKGPGDRY